MDLRGHGGRHRTRGAMRRNCAAVKCRCLMACQNHPTVVRPTAAALWPAITEPTPRKLLLIGDGSSGSTVKTDMWFFFQKTVIDQRLLLPTFESSTNRPSAMAVRFTLLSWITAPPAAAGTASRSRLGGQRLASCAGAILAAIRDGHNTRLRCRGSTRRPRGRVLLRPLCLS